MCYGTIISLLSIFDKIQMFLPEVFYSILALSQCLLVGIGHEDTQLISINNLQYSLLGLIGAHFNKNVFDTVRAFIYGIFF